MRITFPALMLAALALVSVCAQPVRITVDADTAYAIDGETQVQAAVFGLSAYVGASAPAEPEWAPLLRQAGIGCLGFPGDVNACAPASMPADGIAGIEAWYASDEALHEITHVKPLNGRPYM